MRRATFRAILAMVAWTFGLGPRPAGAAEEFVFYHENVMGTALELRVRADDAAAARRAEDRALAEIDRLSSIFSGYDPTSEFRRWQAAPRGPVSVSPELFAILAACDSWRDRSGGAFDPRVQVLTDLWSRGRLPTRGTIDAAKTQMRRPAWTLDPAARTADRLSDAPLTLNAIAKGAIVERACDAALGDGALGVVLNVGGDLRVAGDISRTIAIASAAPGEGSETSEPIAHIEVRDRAVATSGSAQRGFRIEGRWYSHIFDPRTGLPAGTVASATVIAPRSADADALATIFNVLAPEESLRLARDLPGVECLIVAADGRVARSEGWHRFERAGPVAVALADEPKAAPPDAWAGEFELAIKFEINRPDAGGRYRRPYIAVWVEDKDGFPVRNLALWVSFGGAGPFQWLPDMKRWYRADQARRVVDKTNMIDTIAQPTRPPGRYTVIWDGKDDRGRPLPRGEYTVFIDAAREHGTYQNCRAPVTLAATPFAEDLTGNVEIRAASIEYRRKAPGK